MQGLITYLIFSLSVLELISSYHILFLSSVLYRQDAKIQAVIAQGLLNYGDNVTVMAPLSYEDFHKLNFPVLTNFKSLESLAVLQKDSLTGEDGETFFDVMSYTVESCSKFYAEPEISRFLELKQMQEYDAVIVTSLYNECVLPLMVATDANYIILTTTNRIPYYVKYSLGIPTQPSFSPDHWSLNDKLSFTKRMKALFNYRKLLNKLHYWYYGSIDSAAYKVIPTHTSLLDSIQQTSLVLQDANIAIDTSLPTFNSVVPIGGIQCHPGSPGSLPPHVKSFIDEAPYGVIFVSFGTVVTPSKLPYSGLTKLVNVFGRVRQRVLWVFDDLSVINLTDNVLPVAHVNQQDVLAHPNVVLFVTHGGHFSRQEAIYHGVPCIVFPLFDPLQFANADYFYEKKIGIKFDLNAFSEEMLINGVMEVITNPTFKNNIAAISARMRDTLVAPSETALYWIRYTIRNRGCAYLKSHSMTLYWFQYYLIDVKVFIMVSSLLVLYVITGIIRWCHARYLLQKEIARQLKTKQGGQGSDSKKNMLLSQMKNE